MQKCQLGTGVIIQRNYLDILLNPGSLFTTLYVHVLDFYNSLVIILN